MVRDQVRDKLNFTFDDRGEQQVKNIARPLRVFDVKIAGGTTTLASYSGTVAPLQLPDQPSIAVLPFQKMSGDPEQEYFADGVVEEIVNGDAYLLFSGFIEPSRASIPWQAHGHPSGKCWFTPELCLFCHPKKRSTALRNGVLAVSPKAARRVHAVQFRQIDLTDCPQR